MATQKIQSTRNYRLFKRSADNRVFDLGKHKRLERSLRKYGFIPAFPIVCSRNGAKQLTVKDGQHRLTIAESLGLPVFWVEDQTDFDIAEINGTAKTWDVKDYAAKYAANGNEHYQEILDFADQHSIPIGIAAGLLAGTGFTNVRNAYLAGEYKVKDRSFATSVAGIYVPICTLSSAVKNARFLQACMGVCRVPQFEAKRLLQNTQRCREKLVAYSTADAYLNMLEEIYNFGRKQLFGLKAAATMAMRDRNPVLKNKK